MKRESKEGEEEEKEEEGKEEEEGEEEEEEEERGIQSCRAWGKEGRREGGREY